MSSDDVDNSCACKLCDRNRLPDHEEPYCATCLRIGCQIVESLRRALAEDDDDEVLRQADRLPPVYH